MPWSARLLVASASFTGMLQSPVKITVVVMSGLDRLGAERERVDVAQHLRDRLGGDEADLLALAHVAGDHAVQVLRFVDVAEVAAHALGMLGLVPQAAAVRETHRRVLRRQRQDVRVEVAERGGKQQRRAVLRDHALHRLLHRRGLGHVLFFDHLHAGELLDLRGRFGLRLVVAVVVARTDVDEADGDGLLRMGVQTEGGRGTPLAPSSWIMWRRLCRCDVMRALLEAMVWATTAGVAARPTRPRQLMYELVYKQGTDQGLAWRRRVFWHQHAAPRQPCRESCAPKRCALRYAGAADALVTAVVRVCPISVSPPATWRRWPAPNTPCSPTPRGRSSPTRRRCGRPATDRRGCRSPRRCRACR